ncbi:MAG TPA: HAMP domain-containing sensor histidine kinase [Flavisolibacter sp.]|nr:HAMP domain-containing sensor histidine kinase [Flavisolibacter sp.]
MKKIFPIIIVLIALSVLGIIFMQLSWLQNMSQLREDQIKQKVEDITKAIGFELTEHKGNSLPSGFKPFSNAENDLFGELGRPYYVSQRFTTAELYDKIRKDFVAAKLEDVPFEFGLAILMSDNLADFQRKTPNFEAWYDDNTDNYYRHSFRIVTPSGSAGESLSKDEALVVIIPNVHKLVLKDLRPRFAIAFLLSLIIFTAFFLTVRTMLRQKKISEIKNDFINNMTHEFKTPISTISLAVDALRNERVQKDAQKMTYFSDIIKEENQRMNRQVETILKSALMDRQEIQLNLKPLEAHRIIQDVADNFMLRLQEKDGSLELHLKAQQDIIEADEVHFSNLVNNLMDNAVKYSKDNVPPRMTISTSSTEKKFIMRIEDNGIGMNRETLKRIFEKFYRAHTGNLHNVKGFGLGLSYVKDIVEAHDGHVKAESTLGKGSAFTIELPLVKS